ncbi:pilus motility taxis protein HmpF [[Phormidium] sp. ETS-05]|uniref:pilus motility taxis protein HmpF n=1 Tax=[Phormidium] sp. ETS-05 TaxID=222819 RepID=UPI0018EF0434|nr:pilus motility taxis protein HmpF [[Phormidium] sp. ETS-05]
MLYLAEVQKKTGVFGGGKAELKLLAFQRGESWTAVQGDDTIQAEEASSYNPGALVLVDLSASKQVQKVHQDTAREMVGILQNFSRLQEKFKNKEEEIEQWKESLKYQSEVLHQREEEMQAQLMQLEHIHEESSRLEQQRQEVESAREEADRLRDQIESNRKELETAWEQVRSEMQRLEGLQSQLDSSAAQLDEQLAAHLRSLLDYLNTTVPSTEAVREHLNAAVSVVASGQSFLDELWQRYEQDRSTVESQKADVDLSSKELKQEWEQWHQAQTGLEQSRADLLLKETTLNGKLEEVAVVKQQLLSAEELHQQLLLISDGGESVNVSDKVDVAALENMPLEELQGQVQARQQDLEGLFRFVNSQEEELTLQRQDIEELQAKLSRCSDGERPGLETELADQQEQYNMLNETLVGQRRNLREREEILTKHQEVLWRRLGNPPGLGRSKKLDVGPALQKAEELRQNFGAAVQNLTGVVETLQQSLREIRETVNQKAADLEGKQQELKEKEAALATRRQEVLELAARVNLYQEMLQPERDRLQGLSAKLEEIGAAIAHLDETNDYQQQAITQIRDALMPIISPSA